MKKFSAFFIALVVVLGMVSCGEDGTEEVKDTKDPVITLSSPDNTASFPDGGTFDLEGTITDETALASWSYSVSITTPAKKNTVVWTATGGSVATGLSYTIDEPLTVKDLAQLGEYTITVIAVDAAGNDATEARTIKVEAKPVAVK